jgi:hypothetical protein
MFISFKVIGKNQVGPSQESMGDAPLLSHCSLPYQNRPVCWSIIVEKKPTLGSPYFWPFPSDRIPNATEDVNVNFFIRTHYITDITPAKCCQIYQKIPGSF